MKLKFCKTHMRTAELWSEQSYAQRKKVGAILVSPDNTRHLCSGYNGSLPNFPNICEKEVITDGIIELVTLPEVSHAEENLICFCARHGIKTLDCILYVTLSPCMQCAKMIINAGIKTVFYKEIYRNTEGLDLLKRAGVEVIQLDEKELE